MKTIYVVRHGESQANVEKVFAGSRYDSPLTEKGVAQAKTTAAKLRGRAIDVIVSSPLKRAKTTAETIAKELEHTNEIIFEPLLMERDFGTASGKPWSWLIEEELEDGAIEGLESIADLAARVERLIDWLKNAPGEHVLVVTHGSLESMLQALYVGINPSDFLAKITPLENAEIREYLLD